MLGHAHLELLRTGLDGHPPGFLTDRGVARNDHVVARLGHDPDPAARCRHPNRACRGPTRQLVHGSDGMADPRQDPNYVTDIERGAASGLLIEDSDEIVLTREDGTVRRRLRPRFPDGRT